MAEDKKATISRTRNEDNIIYYIARNSSGTIFAKELTLEKLEAAIKIYKEPPPEKEDPSVPSEQEEETDPKEKKFLTNSLSEKVQEKKKEPITTPATTSVEPEVEKDIKLLENDLQEKVQGRREQSKKKSFWDKLK